ncbi:hypothetical protein ID852_18045 [Xenorhabdus sp. 42]|nr:hypothetical protein [Xenorhabdus sp. 42]MBD2822544.1 hypothetical protein [Xenorhabdus sp. 42]
MKTGNNTYKESTTIRDTYRILPFQGVWTWLTGKDIPDRKPLWKSNSIEMIFWSISWMIIGTLFIYWAVTSQISLFFSIIIYSIGVLFASSGA